jgi:alanine-glyoxylate transaminase/serine-glyoxylate transaminase/serine-pyruvate transaminase
MAGLSAPINGYEEAKRPKLFIPGPIEMSPEVLAASGGGMRSFVDTTLIEDFGKSIELVRKTFLSSGQPFILSGSGVIGWDAVACNLMVKGDKVLQVNSGFFSSRFEHTYAQYGMQVTSVGSPQVGTRPDNLEVERTLREAKAAGKPFKVLSISGVDTSTAVLADLKNLCDISRATSPETFIGISADISIKRVRYFIMCMNIYLYVNVCVCVCVCVQLLMQYALLRARNCEWMRGA